MRGGYDTLPPHSPVCLAILCLIRSVNQVLTEVLRVLTDEVFQNETWEGSRSVSVALYPLGRLGVN